MRQQLERVESVALRLAPLLQRKLHDIRRIASLVICPLDAFAFDKVDFIKIDVEGHEEKVIAGGWATIIANTPTLLVELEDRHNPGCVGRVAARFADIGYQMRFLDNDLWLDLDSLADNQIGPSGRYINNFLLVPARRADEFTGG